MLYIILILCGIVTAVFVLLHLRKETDHQKRMIEKFRASETYAGIYPVLKSFKPRMVEQIQVRPEELKIRLLPPDNRLLRYRFERVRGDKPSPEILQALAQTLAVDIPELGNRKKYITESRQETGPDGKPYRWYSYTLRTAEKDRILRGMEVRHNAGEE